MGQAIDGATLDELGESDFKKMGFQNPMHISKMWDILPGLPPLRPHLSLVDHRALP